MSQDEVRESNIKPRPRIKFKEGSSHTIEKIRNFKSVPKSHHKKSHKNFEQDREDILLSFHHQNDRESQALNTLRHLNEEEDTWDHSLEIENHLKNATANNISNNPPKNPKSFLQKSSSVSCFKLPAPSSPNKAKRTYKLPMISVLKDTFSVSEENLSASLPRRLHGFNSYRNVSPTEKITKIQDIKDLRDSYLYGRGNAMLALGSMKSVAEEKEAKPQLSERMKKSLEEEDNTEDEEDQEDNPNQTREATSLENFDPCSKEGSPKEQVMVKESGSFEPNKSASNFGRKSFFRVTFSGTNGFKKTARENNNEHSQGKNEKENKKSDHNVLNDLIQKSWHDKELFRKILHKHSDEDLIQLKIRFKKDKEEKKNAKPKKERSQSRALTARMPVLAIDLKENVVDETENNSGELTNTNTNTNLIPTKAKSDRRESTKSLEKSQTVLGNHYKNSIIPSRRQSEKLDKKTFYEKTQDKVVMKGYNIFKLSSVQVPAPITSQTLNPTPQNNSQANEELPVKAPKAPHVRNLSLAFNKNRQIERPSLVYVAQTHREFSSKDHETSSTYGTQRLRKIGATSPTYLSVPKERTRDIKSFLTTRALPGGEEQDATEDISITKRRSPIGMGDSRNEKEGTVSKVLEQKINKKVNVPKLFLRRVQL